MAYTTNLSWFWWYFIIAFTSWLFYIFSRSAKTARLREGSTFSAGGETCFHVKRVNQSTELSHVSQRLHGFVDPSKTSVHLQAHTLGACQAELQDAKSWEPQSEIWEHCRFQTTLLWCCWKQLAKSSGHVARGLLSFKKGDQILVTNGFSSLAHSLDWRVWATSTIQTWMTWMTPVTPVLSAIAPSSMVASGWFKVASKRQTRQLAYVSCSRCSPAERATVCILSARKSKSKCSV